MTYTHVIWDFNGTILDDVQIGIDSVNVLLRKRGLPTVDSVDEYREVFEFPIIKYYEYLGFDFVRESFDDIAVEWVTEYNSRRNLAPIQEGVRKLLEEFKTRGIKQSIVSASELGMLTEQLRELGVSEYFCDIAGLDHIKATSKTHLAEEWRRQNPDAKALFIGDTDHDLTAALAMGADCVLVACGHQTFEALSKSGAEVFHTMNELFEHLFG